MKTVTVPVIQSEADYDAALERANEIWGAPPGSEEGDEIDALITIIESFEAAHHPIDPPDPIEAILFRIDQLGLKRADLEPFLGGRGRVSEILNRKRHLSITMIRNLQAGLGISADTLIRDYPLHRETA